MPKIRSNRAAQKRFRRTASGKFKRGKAFRRHILTKKTQKTKRNLRKKGMVAKADLKEVRTLIPY